MRTRTKSAKDTQNTIRRVKRTCHRLGLLPFGERYDGERQELRLRFATDAPAIRLRSELIKARISAATLITGNGAAVLVHLDAAEELQTYTARRHAEAA